MAGSRFQVPDFIGIDKGNAESFACAFFFDNRTEQQNAFLRRAATRQDDVGNVILGNARFFDIGVGG